MTLRQLPGTLILGLVAALTAHAGLFGGEHVVGGAYNGTLVQLTLAAVTGLAAAAGFVLWTGARFAADGSVLAARIGKAIPGFAPLAIATTGWFTLAEHLESAHAGVSPLAVGVALLLAAWLVLRLAGAALRLLAGAVFSLALPVLCHPELVEGRIALPAALRQAQRDTLWARRFSRPPPVHANALAR